ncbi:hypothetical protein GpartN1_g5346.t1 [Galdieria partita]|uniref:Fucosyltransferase n=1 Tax=Galdieria partita TaxID=83374 RepID=A0A9C7USL4_9RHOD|nr:hypothetical protein GpartN1_g5346.t1 [Galdieria partita]
MEWNGSRLLFYLPFLFFGCWLVSGLTYSNGSFWRLSSLNYSVPYWKIPETERELQQSIQKFLFSVERAPVWEHYSLEQLAECLYNDVDIVFWTRVLSGVQLEKFYSQLMDLYLNSNQCPQLFVIHVQHGLGNRLRVLASALAYVQLIPYLPILIWETDHHMGAKWEDLFEDLPNVVISDLEDAFEKVLKNPSGNYYVIDYMKMTTQQRYPLPLDYAILQHIYWKSSCVLRVVGSQPHLNRRFHHFLKSQFSKLIPTQPLKQAILENCPREPFVAFHIRRRLLHEETFVTNDPQSEYGYISARLIDKYRSMNRVINFCSIAARLLSLYPFIAMYIAADSQLSYMRWFQCLQNKVAVDSRRIFPLSVSNCENRSRLCIQKALVDLYCLSRAEVLFGSFWSSFTEVAHYLNSNDQSLFYLDTNSFFRNGSIKNETKFHVNVKEKLAYIFSEVAL